MTAPTAAPAPTQAYPELVELPAELVIWRERTRVAEDIAAEQYITIANLEAAVAEHKAMIDRLIALNSERGRQVATLREALSDIVSMATANTVQQPGPIHTTWDVIAGRAYNALGKPPETYVTDPKRAAPLADL
jgi:hypothetical protein